MRAYFVWVVVSYPPFELASFAVCQQKHSLSNSSFLQRPGNQTCHSRSIAIGCPLETLRVSCQNLGFVFHKHRYSRVVVVLQVHRKCRKYRAPQLTKLSFAPDSVPVLVVDLLVLETGIMWENKRFRNYFRSLRVARKPSVASSKSFFFVYSPTRLCTRS